MGICHSGDHIVGDHVHLHMDITTCNIEKPQKKYCFEMVNNR